VNQVIGGHGLENLFGQQQAGSTVARQYKPIKVGMLVLDVTQRPYREVVVNKLATRYADGGVEFALIGYDRWCGKRTEWVRVYDLVPIE